MAIELIARIWERPKNEVDSSEKFVLTVMADRADDEGLLWYAVETIAQKTSFTERAVQKIMDRLIAKGLVKKLQRRNRSNYYVIQVDKFPHVERKRKPKEQGPAEFVAELDVEPDLFGTGERRSGTGERRSSTGERRSGTGEPGSPDSLIDSLNDPLMDAREGALESLEDFIVRHWNELAEKHEALAPVRPPLSPARKKLIESRTDDGLASWTDVETPRTLWKRIIETVESSRLLTGQKLDWAASLDWILGPKNFAKILGGNYGHGHDSTDNPPPGSGGRSAVAAGREARSLVERSRQRRRPDAGGAGGHSGRAAGAR